MDCQRCLHLKPCSALALARRHPGILNRTTLSYPLTMFGLWRRTDAVALDEFLSVAPTNIFDSTFPGLLRCVGRRTLLSTVPYLINKLELHPALVATLTALNTTCLGQVLGTVPKSKLALVLRIPQPDKLATLARVVSADRAGEVLVPVLQEPDAILQNVLIPLICSVREPERIGILANHVPVQVLLWLMRGLELEHLVAVLDSMQWEDLQAQGNAAMLLSGVIDEPELVDTKIIPLMQRGDAAKIAKMVHNVAPERLLELLRRVELENMLKLLEHTNIDLAIQILNGPLDKAVAHTSSLMGLALHNKHVAQCVEHLTDDLSHKLEGVQKVNERGKRERGVSADAAYQFGDLTRGIVATVTETAHKDFSDALKRGREARGSTDEGYKFGDFTRGLLAGFNAGSGDSQSSST